MGGRFILGFLLRKFRGGLKEKCLRKKWEKPTDILLEEANKE
jgi:hypothetical protein